MDPTVRLIMNIITIALGAATIIMLVCVTIKHREIGKRLDKLDKKSKN